MKNEELIFKVNVTCLEITQVTLTYNYPFNEKHINSGMLIHEPFSDYYVSFFHNKENATEFLKKYCEYKKELLYNEIKKLDDCLLILNS